MCIRDREEAGADLIELGIPFSDPTAEGPVIQRANVRALSGGVTTDKVFDMVVKIRKNSSVPMAVSYTHLQQHASQCRKYEPLCAKPKEYRLLCKLNLCESHKFARYVSGFL